LLQMRFFFLHDTATPVLYTLSLHDALPILFLNGADDIGMAVTGRTYGNTGVEIQEAVAVNILDDRAFAALCDERVGTRIGRRDRSEEHTSELQSLAYLVCRLLLEKKK